MSNEVFGLLFLIALVVLFLVEGKHDAERWASRHDPDRERKPPEPYRP